MRGFDAIDTPMDIFAGLVQANPIARAGDFLIGMAGTGRAVPNPYERKALQSRRIP
jgi:hypothetical protein